MKNKEYLIEWDVWNAQTQTYEPESLCDFAYADSPELAIDIMMDYVCESDDNWTADRDNDVVYLHHERYDRHEDRTIVKDLEYRNFRIRPTE